MCSLKHPHLSAFAIPPPFRTRVSPVSFQAQAFLWFPVDAGRSGACTWPSPQWCPDNFLLPRSWNEPHVEQPPGPAPGLLQAVGTPCASPLLRAELSPAARKPPLGRRHQQ